VTLKDPANPLSAAEVTITTDPESPALCPPLPVLSVMLPAWPAKPASGVEISTAPLPLPVDFPEDNMTDPPVSRKEFPPCNRSDEPPALDELPTCIVISPALPLERASPDRNSSVPEAPFSVFPL